MSHSHDPAALEDSPIPSAGYKNKSIILFFQIKWDLIGCVSLTTKKFLNNCKKGGILATKLLRHTIKWDHLESYPFGGMGCWWQ